MASRAPQELVQDLDASRTPEQRALARREALVQLEAAEASPEDVALALATLELDGAGGEA